MSCLGGTWQEPREWMRFINGDPTRELQLGRVCDETKMPWASTKKRLCSGCPAYRGPTMDGGRQEALGPDLMTIQSLSKSEWEQYDKWVEEEFEPERFYAYLEGGVKGWTEEQQAEYMKRYRAGNPEYREQERDAAKVRMRAYRARQKALRNRPAPARDGALG